MQPLSQAVLLERFPPETRGTATALFGLGIVVAAVILVLEDPPYIRAARPRRIDGLGFGLMAVFLGALQLVLGQARMPTGLQSYGYAGLPFSRQPASMRWREPVISGGQLRCAP